MDASIIKPNLQVAKLVRNFKDIPSCPSSQDNLNVNKYECIGQTKETRGIKNLLQNPGEIDSKPLVLAL